MHPFINETLTNHLVKAVQQANRAVQPHVGKGDKHAIDAAAVNALRDYLNGLDYKFHIVSGEGEKDGAGTPMLARGEVLGKGTFELDVAVDPVDGTTAAAQNLPNATIAIAAAARGAILPLPDIAMERIVVGARLSLAGVGLDDPLAQTLANFAAQLEKPVTELKVYCRNSPRNKPWFDAAKATGAQIIEETPDVAHGLAVHKSGFPVDVLVGLGGGPETLLITAGLKPSRGHMLARPWVDSSIDFGTRVAAIAQANGVDLQRVYGGEDLVKAPSCFACAAVTGGVFLPKGGVFALTGA